MGARREALFLCSSPWVETKSTDPLPNEPHTRARIACSHRDRYANRTGCETGFTIQHPRDEPRTRPPSAERTRQLTRPSLNSIPKRHIHFFFPFHHLSKPNQARGVSSRVFGLVERLASKGQGKVSETFGSAALKLKGLLVSEKDNKRLVENGGEVARDVWKTLSQSAGENDAFGDIKQTVTRIMQRLKDVMKQLQEDKLLVEKSREEEEKRADAAEAEAFSRGAFFFFTRRAYRAVWSTV